MRLSVMATIRKRNGKYHVQIRKKGVAPLTSSFKDRATALQWAKKVESEIDRYIYLDISAAQTTTVSKVLNKYSKEVLPTQKGGEVEKYRIKILKEQLGKTYLADLKPYLLADYRDTRLQVVSGSTVRKELSLLSRVLNTSIKDWGIDLPNGNPVTQIRLPAPPAGRDRRLSKEEEAILIAALSRATTVRTITLLALETAMRRGEILSMDWDHIDLKNRTLHIPITKTDTPRTI
jgi:integrase